MWTALRQRLMLVCLTLSLVCGVAAVSATAASADEVFQPRTTVGPYAEGKHSTEGMVDLIQGEGWQYESCVDFKAQGGGYTKAACMSAGHPEEQRPENEGYARVWNAQGGNNEIWGWARF